MNIINEHPWTFVYLWSLGHYSVGQARLGFSRGTMGSGFSVKLFFKKKADFLVSSLMNIF